MLGVPRSTPEVTLPWDLGSAAPLVSHPSAPAAVDRPDLAIGEVFGGAVAT
jgi:hypothetical protein